MSTNNDGVAGVDEGATVRIAAAGKYMIFRLAEEEYGLEILKVRDLNRLMRITRVPSTRPFIRGVINLRGKVIPVVDLRLKLGMGRLEENEWTVIVVVQYVQDGQELTMGILVDEVLEVLNVTAAQIAPPPSFGAGTADGDFLIGVGKVDERVIFLLDIGSVLSAEETSNVAQVLAGVLDGQAKPAGSAPAER